MIQFYGLPACLKYYRSSSLANTVGMIPMFLSESDPRPAREQFNERYAHGGGWRSFNGFELSPGPTPALLDGDNIPNIKYPGDPIMPPLAYAMLRDEMIVIYQYAWVMILQPDGSYEISRMD